MARSKPKTVLYRRKRENKTNYNKRLKLLLSRKHRVVVRVTNKRVIGQVVDFTQKGDKVLVGVDSTALKKLGWNYSLKNIPAAYLTGLLLGKQAVAKGYKEAILDSGLKTPLQKGKLYAFLKGVLDGGVDVAHGEESIFPDEEKVSGKHIVDYAAALKDNQELDKKQFAKREETEGFQRPRKAMSFSGYLKNNAQPEKMAELFAQVKQKISS